MWRRVEHGSDRIRRGGRPIGRKVELIGGPLDGGAVGEPLEMYAQFILVPSDGSYRGPYPVHTYVYCRETDRYHYAGSGVQAPPPRR